VRAAKADQLLVSEATYSKIADRVAAVAMPPMRFKNKSEEQRVFNVIGMRGHDWKHETTKPF
jgi:class 3 adenylate cyclase